ncbi:hypothetical protein [Mesorhizobium sp. L-8-10]|uniref:hypothetical protein n=1 Tax=Mesorhizobium sp. L-8-10 TaxID=2744523 RepID=UPI0019284441|nr:hypothetical protein [Mesorhizobium sp. L-8-10]
MNDLIDLRIGRLSITIFWSPPFIRFGWNRIPHLMKSFGWTWWWVRGVGHKRVK